MVELISLERPAKDDGRVGLGSLVLARDVSRPCGATIKSKWFGAIESVSKARNPVSEQ